MSQQIQITGGAKVRNLQDVIIGTSGVLSSVAFDVANGVPRLDVNGKILVSQLPNSVMEYKGTWNAATNTPTLANGTGNQGDVYLCNVAGTTNFGAGAIAFVVGDQVIYSGSIWQRASGATGTVTSVAITESGDSLNITGSPITTSGTINIGFNGTNLQYVNGAGNLTTFPILTGYVPYTGATANVNLGAFDLYTSKVWLYDNPNSAYGSMELTDGVLHFEDVDGHSMVTMEDGYLTIANASTIRALLNVSGLSANRDYAFPNASGTLSLTSDLANYVNLTTAQTIGGTKTFSDATKNNGGIFLQNASSSSLAGYMNLGGLTNGVKFTSGGGISNSFTLPSATGYTFTFPNATGTLALTSDIPILTGYVPYTGATTNVDLGNFSATGNTSNFRNSYINGTASVQGQLMIKQAVLGSTNYAGYSSIYSTGSNITVISDVAGTTYKSAILSFGSLTNNTNRTYTFPDASGTIALVGGSGVGTVTSVAALTLGTTGTDLSSSVATGTTTPVITLNVPTASAANRGALSSADWSAFNGKQAALSGTGFVKISGTTISYDNSTYYLASNPQAFISLLSLSSSATGLTYTNTTGVFSFTAGYSIPTNASQTQWDTAYSNRISTLNGLTAATQNFSTGMSGTDFNISSTTATHTFNIPSASATARGLLSSADWSTFNNKQNALTNPVTGTGNNNYIAKFTSTGSTIGNSSASDNGTTFDVSIQGKFTGLSGGRNLTLNAPTDGGSLTFETGGTAYADMGSNKAILATGSATNFYLGTRAGYSLSFGTANTARLFLDASGNLGLGVTPSAWISGNLAFEIVSASGLSSDGTSIRMQTNAFVNTSGSWIYKSNGAASFYSTGAGSHAWYNAPSGTAGNAISFTQAMTLGSNSGLSIGTTTAAAANGLLVAGAATFSSSVTATTATLSGSSSDRLIMTRTSVGTYHLSISATNRFAIYDPAADSERLCITSGGNVGIGTTSPSGKLHIAATTGVATPGSIALAIRDSGNSGYGFDFNLEGVATGDLSLMRTELGVQAQIITFKRSNGNVLVGTTTDNGLGLLQIGSSANGKISLTGGATQNGMRWESVATANTFYLFNGNYGPGPGWGIYNVTTAGLPFWIQNSGAATFSSSVTATSFFESSDSRLKTLIQDNYKTKGIGEITPKLYTKNGKVELGYYAQDFIGILDNAISKGSDDMLSLSYREVHTAKIYALEQEIKELKAKMN